MHMLPTPFDFDNEMTDKELDIFTDCIVFDDIGDFESFRHYNYMSEIVERLLNKNKEPLEKSDDIIARYSKAIERNKTLQKNAKVKNELNLVSTPAGEAETKSMFGTVNENLVSSNSKEDGGLFETTETIDELDSVAHSLKTYQELKNEFERVEGVDLDMLIVRALQEVPQAVGKLAHLVEKHGFLGSIIQDIMKAREWGHDVLPSLD